MAMVVRANPATRASAATSRPTPRRRRSTRSASTTSSAAARTARAIRSTSRATPPRASTRGCSSRGGSPSRSSTQLPARDGAGHGLSSYPHPWLMPEFWEFPTVSMGLGPIMRHLPGALQPLPPAPRPQGTSASQGLGVLGDGETDEPESLGALTLRPRARARQPDLRRQLQPAAPGRAGARQRQDHPGARGGFRGAGWNVLKVIWGSRVGPLLARDTRAGSSGSMNETSTASTRSTSVEGGAYIREHFFGATRSSRRWSPPPDEQMPYLAGRARPARSTPPTRRRRA
jgi:hypothetical protein